VCRDGSYQKELVRGRLDRRNWESNTATVVIRGGKGDQRVLLSGTAKRETLQPICREGRGEACRIELLWWEGIDRPRWENIGGPGEGNCDQCGGVKLAVYGSLTARDGAEVDSTRRIIEDRACVQTGIQVKEGRG